MEIYRTPLSPVFIGMTYAAVADIIYKKFGATLVGVERSVTTVELLRTGSFVKSRASHCTQPVEFSQLMLATTDYAPSPSHSSHSFDSAGALGDCGCESYCGLCNRT